MSFYQLSELVRQGKITTDQAADLIELRRRIRWNRKPWWERAAAALWRVLFS